MAGFAELGLWFCQNVLDRQLQISSHKSVPKSDGYEFGRIFLEVFMNSGIGRWTNSKLNALNTPMQSLNSHVKSLSINVLIYWLTPIKGKITDNEKLDLMTRADKVMWRSNVQYWAPPPAWIIQPVFLRGENTKTIWLPSKKYESSSLQHCWQQWRQKRKDCCCASSFSLYNVFPAFLWPATTPPDLKLSDKGGKKVGSPP